MTKHPSHFHRSAALPFIESRSVADGRLVCYDTHSHDVFSIGAITAGACRYWHVKSTQTITAGTVVLMNAGEAHACNPLRDAPWSYVMLYVDVAWLREAGFGADLAACMSTDAVLFESLLALHATLLDERYETAVKYRAVVNFFTLLHSTIPLAKVVKSSNPKLTRAANFIDAQFTHNLSLTDVCAASNLSAAHLVRAFKAQYGMTPHAYLINRRINHAQTQLKQGNSIAAVAHDMGFADQAHFQRRFKRVVAATPEHYRKNSLCP